MSLDQNIARAAAAQANTLFGKWMPERWLNLFIDSYNDIEACRLAELPEPDGRPTTPKGDWFPYPVKDKDV